MVSITQSLTSITIKPDYHIVIQPAPSNNTQPWKGPCLKIGPYLTQVTCTEGGWESTGGEIEGLTTAKMHRTYLAPESQQVRAFTFSPGTTYVKYRQDMTQG